jgi:hypothetical protein
MLCFCNKRGQTSHIRSRYVSGPYSLSPYIIRGPHIYTEEHVRIDSRGIAKSAESNFKSDILIIGLNNINYYDQGVISNTSHCEVIIGEDGMIKEQYQPSRTMTLYTKAAARQNDPGRKPERPQISAPEHPQRSFCVCSNHFLFSSSNTRIHLRLYLSSSHPALIFIFPSPALWSFSHSSLVLAINLWHHFLPLK